MKRMGGFWQGAGCLGTRGRGKFSSLEILATASCELRVCCVVTVKVLCYVRFYADLWHVRALAGNDFFDFFFIFIFIDLVSWTKGLDFEGFSIAMGGRGVPHVRISFRGI
jgi:hypothetical protein